MLNQTSAEARTFEGADSTKPLTGVRRMDGAEAATATPVVAQQGQKWEVPPAVVRSAQRWNCAARNTSPSRRTQSRNLAVLFSTVKPIASPECYLKSIVERNKTKLEVTAEPK